MSKPRGSGVGFGLSPYQLNPTPIPRFTAADRVEWVWGVASPHHFEMQRQPTQGGAWYVVDDAGGQSRSYVFDGDTYACIITAKTALGATIGRPSKICVRS